MQKCACAAPQGRIQAFVGKVNPQQPCAVPARPRERTAGFLVVGSPNSEFRLPF